jgi:hypothetical protein
MMAYDGIGSSANVNDLEEVLRHTIRADASPAARGTETAADCPAANTASNRATAALSLAPC